MLGSNASYADIEWVERLVRAVSDDFVEGHISRLKIAIAQWARENDVVGYIRCYDFLETKPAEPPCSPILAMMSFDGEVYDSFNGGHEQLAESFSDLLAQHDAWYELETHISLGIHLNEDKDPVPFLEYFHWKWICSLVEDDVSDVYDELFRYFHQKPDQLYYLDWRAYERFLASLFRQQGFDVELGPGRGDEGVDLRLIQRDPLGDIVTLVQAKKHHHARKIDQTNVAALYGIQKAEGADGSLFVTTASYAPVAKRFASRETVKDEMTLADSSHVSEWCSLAEKGIIRDKSALVSQASVSALISCLSASRDTRLVVASYGYGIIRNQFAVVVKEAKYAALLMMLDNAIVEHDGYEQRGTEVPIIDPSLPRFNSYGVFRARKSIDHGKVSYWDGKHTYYPWDGTPQYFDLLD